MNGILQKEPPSQPSGLSSLALQLTNTEELFELFRSQL